jgi:hypothetical protein
MSLKQKPATTDKTDEPKKPYNTPRLSTYGQVREITKTTGGTVGMNDGGSGKDKTGF